MPQLKMYRPDIPLPNVPMPEGYYVRDYVKGEGPDWCKCCIGDFGVKEFTQNLFNRKMVDDPEVRGEGVLFICSPSGMVAGTACAKTPPDLTDTGYLHYVGVAPKYRGNKLGAPICAAVVERLREQGRPKCILTTDDWRVPAVKIYLNLGWIPVMYLPEMRGRWEQMLKLLKIPSSKAMNDDWSITDDIIAAK